MTIHPGWNRSSASPVEIEAIQPPKTVHRCWVCKSQFVPNIHIHHQVLCGNPECKKMRHRMANRKHDAKRSHQNPNDHPESRHTGVRWRARKKPWAAQIKVDGKMWHLGSFDTEDEAAEAFQQARRNRDFAGKELR